MTEKGDSIEEGRFLLHADEIRDNFVLRVSIEQKAEIEAPDKDADNGSERGA
jgi:hypothetical protein